MGHPQQDPQEESYKTSAKIYIHINKLLPTSAYHYKTQTYKTTLITHLNCYIDSILIPAKNLIHNLIISLFLEPSLRNMKNKNL